MRLLESLIGRPVEAPPALLGNHPELASVRLRRGGLPVRIAGWLLGASSAEAVTLGRTVFLSRRAAITPALLLHELRHVQQFSASRTFPFAYAWETLRHGYVRNRFERDARDFAQRRLSAGDVSTSNRQA